MDGSWENLVTVFGPAGALLAIGFILLLKRKLITATEKNEIEARGARELLECATRHENEKIEWRDRYNELKKEKDTWQDMALRAAGVAEKSVELGRKVAENGK